MLDKMIESRGTARESKFLKKLLVGVGSLTTGLFTAALIFSIFSTNLAMSGDGLEITSLAPPVDIPEPAPEPEPEPQVDRPQKAANTNAKLPTRVVNMKRVDETPTKVPNAVKVTKNRHEARPNGNFEIAPIDSKGTASGPRTDDRKAVKGGGLVETKKETPKVVENKTKPEKKKTTPPPPKLKKKPEVLKISVIDQGKAKRLVQPVKSAAAIAVNAKGNVKVSVLISESGRVLSANAVSGHPLLRKAAARAAKKSTFKPTKLNGAPVKVSGLIIYRFK